MPEPSQPPAPMEPRSAPVSVTSERDLEIRRLLAEASSAVEENRLTTPVDDNAYYRYLRVLSLDPANQAAEEGISTIVEKYLEWAIDNARQQRFRQAINFLNRARSVDENHPSIDAVAKLIDDQRRADEMTYRLSPNGVEQHAERVVGELYEIGRRIAQHDARVVIIGRTDAEGRWIYQQLNDATPLRVRARFETGDYPAVRLIY
ncbi:MAG: hypothetical protein HUJ31_16485 [Pseudomonadales bacterium]|nr:hypothetical protein [Pseudomonadales bacterium]